MSEAKNTREEIERIEEAYEYMLAYAAQGRADEGAGPDGAHIRTFLKQFHESLTHIQKIYGNKGKGKDDLKGFTSAMNQDAETVASVIKILLNQKNISSEMIDNANGLIFVRSYLTSLFFLDKAVLENS